MATTRGAIARPDLVLVVVDDGVERGRVDQPLLDQQRLQRLDPQRYVGRRFLAMVVLMAVMIMLHDRNLTQRGCRVKRLGLWNGVQAQDD
ncbi:MAG: hypothetical protein WDM85_16420 [Caulobacteraceae bacterium]